MLLIFPIAAVVVISKEGGWKYGFTFIQSTLNVALFVSFAIGFLVSLYHALSFDEVEDAPEENYMKTHQTVFVKSEKSIEDLRTELESDTKFKDISLANGVLLARKKVHFLSADRIEYKKEGEVFTLSSKPFAKWWFIDFARNYKTVKKTAQYLKGKI